MNAMVTVTDKKGTSHTIEYEVVGDYRIRLREAIGGEWPEWAPMDWFDIFPHYGKIVSLETTVQKTDGDPLVPIDSNIVLLHCEDGRDMIIVGYPPLDFSVVKASRP